MEPIKGFMFYTLIILTNIVGGQTRKVSDDQECKEDKQSGFTVADHYNLIPNQEFRGEDGKLFRFKFVM